MTTLTNNSINYILSLVARAAVQAQFETSTSSLYNGDCSVELTDTELLADARREVKGWYRGCHVGYYSNNVSDFECVRDIFIDAGEEEAWLECLTVTDGNKLLARQLLESVMDSVEREQKNQDHDYSDDDGRDNIMVGDGADMLHDQILERSWLKACIAAKQTVYFEQSVAVRDEIARAFLYNLVPESNLFGRKFKSIWDFKVFVTGELVKSSFLAREHREQIRSLAYLVGKMSKEKVYYQFAKKMLKKGKGSKDVADALCNINRFYSFHSDRWEEYRSRL
jgi:hypothetical protein